MTEIIVPKGSFRKFGKAVSRNSQAAGLAVGGTQDTRRLKPSGPAPRG